MKPHFLRRPEGVLWLGGVALLLLMGLELVLISILFPDLLEGVVLGLSAEILTGREGGIPVAIAAGVPRFIVWQLSVTQDLAGALFAFPFFLLLLERYRHRDNVLMRRVRRIEAAAERHQKYVHRWGPIGLAAFMVVPFLVNGPLIALIVGRLAGMRHRDMVGPIVVATIVVAGAWTFAFDRMHAVATAFDPRLGWVLAGGAIAVVGGLALVDFVRAHLLHAGQADAGKGEGDEESE